MMDFLLEFAHTQAAMTAVCPPDKAITMETSLCRILPSLTSLKNLSVSLTVYSFKALDFCMLSKVLVGICGSPVYSELTLL